MGESVGLPLLQPKKRGVWIKQHDRWSVGLFVASVSSLTNPISHQHIHHPPVLLAYLPLS